MREFFRELLRCNVVKVATVYLVVGWGVIQAADVLFPALALPKWTITLVVALVIVGFPRRARKSTRVIRESVDGGSRRLPITTPRGARPSKTWT
jgi:hypothetical protein